MPNIASARDLPVRPPRIGITTLAATLSLNLLALALPLVVLQVFDRVIPFEATETLFYLFLGLCVVAALEFILKWSRAVLLGAKAEKFETKLSEYFVDATLNAEPEAFRTTTPASHLDRLNAISQLRSHYGGQARILSIDLPFTLIFVAMIALIGGWLVLVPLASMALLLMFKAALTRAQSAVFDKRKTLDARRYSFLAEVLSQIRTLKANTMEAQMQRRYELLQQQTADISQRVILFSGFSQSFGALFSQMAVAGMGLFGGYLVIAGQIGIAELAACMLLNGRTVQPMLKALSLWAQSESLTMAQAKLSEACSLPQRDRSAAPAETFEGRIDLDAVSLKHPDREAFLLEEISASLPAGGCLVLTGNHASAKSALLKLLLAEVPLQAGRVMIDNLPAERFISLRGPGGIVCCDQAAVVFSGTVLENISAFGDGETIETALALAEELGLNKILHRLPMGYNTPLHENQALLNNANFLQTLSVVRALALRPRLLLLNNVTVSMDDTTRTRLAAVLARLKGDTTLVISTSDPMLIDLADQALEFDTGTARMTRDWLEDDAADRQANDTVDGRIAG